MSGTIRLVDDEGRELASLELDDDVVLVGGIKVSFPEGGIPVKVRGRVTGHIVNTEPIGLPVDGVLHVRGEYVEIPRPRRRRAKSSPKNPGAGSDD